MVLQTGQEKAMHTTSSPLCGLNQQTPFRVTMDRNWEGIPTRNCRLNQGLRTRALLKLPAHSDGPVPPELESQISSLNTRSTAETERLSPVALRNGEKNHEFRRPCRTPQLLASDPYTATKSVKKQFHWVNGKFSLALFKDSWIRCHPTQQVEGSSGELYKWKMFIGKKTGQEGY